MMTIIDLGSELLIDNTSIGDPYVRLAIASYGKALVRGSPWVVVNKQLAVFCGIFRTVEPVGRSKAQLQSAKELHVIPS
jgi:hypothetical protein